MGGNDPVGEQESPLRQERADQPFFQPIRTPSAITTTIAGPNHYVMRPTPYRPWSGRGTPTPLASTASGANIVDGSLAPRDE